MRLIIVSLCLTACFNAVAEPEKLLESLRTELQVEVKKVSEDVKTSGGPRLFSVQSLMSMLPASGELTDEKISHLLAVLDQVRRVPISEKVDQLCLDLAKELRERMAQHTKMLNEKLDATLRSALTRGLSATKAEDVDAPLRELSKLQKEAATMSYRGEGGSIINTESLQAVEQILTAIQDAWLAASNSKALRRSGNLAERIQSAGTSHSRQLVDLIPRSELLEKLQALSERLYPVKALTQREFDKQVQDWVSGVKNLDDLDGVITKVDDLANKQREWNAYYGDSNLAGQLRSYRHVYEEFRAGTGTLQNFSGSYISQGTESLSGIKDLILKFGLPRVLHAPADLAPTADETIPAFLQRALDQARSTSDWQLMAGVVDAASSMGIAVVATASDSVALRYFLGGLNLEGASQFSSAVVSYSAALKTGSLVVPVEKIGALLAAIKKAHPQEYETGVTLSVNPVDDRLGRFPRATGGYSPGSGPAGASRASSQIPAVPASPKPVDAAKETRKNDPQKSATPAK